MERQHAQDMDRIKAQRKRDKAEAIEKDRRHIEKMEELDRCHKQERQRCHKEVETKRIETEEQLKAFKIKAEELAKIILEN
ncbi:expressed unknown protein [Seminavis robusta]|uniref:Uncharacterized protein n=1 Tax=Seminavis robusta TaxID=568900 RepID=A0A9N8ERG8_9STRA|nr:expressed unknown protein [Seminavis robusta]|eukprot:Sro1878_g303130.1 n/a (81) ;mRNA; r:8843-9085